MSTVDPMDDAVAAAESSGQYFGRLDISAQYVVLRKGERKRAWVEGDDTDGRVSEVTLRLDPHDITGMSRLVERQALANSREWSNIIWPSLRDLGFKSLRDANGKWARITLVKNGETYEKNGETIHKTTFKFLAVYELEGDLIKAWEEVHGPKAHTTAPSSTPTTGAAGFSQNSEADKAKFLPFLSTFVKLANGDLAKLAEILKQNAPVFTVDSPEVQQLLLQVA